MNIIIVDDDKLVSLSLKTILEATPDINVLAMGANGEEAISLYDEYKPDVLLMDIRMDKLNGLDAAKIIIEKYPDAKILLLTTFSDDEYIIKAIGLGAKGYILKQAFETIAPAINAVYNGQTVFGDEIMNKIPSLMKKQDNVSYSDFGLTDKEFDIIRLVADGLNNKEIAAEMFFGEGTVRNYISTILEKLELRDRTQLACFYYKHF
ncbi:MAG: response regulator transcription factor [Lachnospiraceae bacterium]|nr:response regulator transcription factor [Lachnospiraceae bacterium]